MLCITRTKLGLDQTHPSPWSHQLLPLSTCALDHYKARRSLLTQIPSPRTAQGTIICLEDEVGLPFCFYHCEMSQPSLPQLHTDLGRSELLVIGFSFYVVLQEA